MDEVVPWACTDEWKQVYRLIYSGDVRNLKKGFEMMRGWKSRCTKLHAGLECTYVIVEALITGHQLHESLSSRSHDPVASCYAMAITRFLNLASTFEKERACYSMYKIARRLKLPEWIVNLRHQSAHGHDLPPTKVLETALILALEWVDKEYWKRGLQGAEWTNSEDQSLVKKFQKRLSHLTKAYQELKILQMNSKTDVKSAEYTVIMQEFLVESDDEWINNNHKNTPSKVKSMPHTLRKCIMIILKKLLTVLKMAEKECIDVGLLLDSFLMDSIFLPNERSIEDFDPHPNDIPQEILPRNLILMWNNMLEDVIFKAGLVEIFMEKLINFESPSELSNILAAIWVKQIALSMKSIELIRNVYPEEEMVNNDFECQIRPLVVKLKQENPSQMWNLVFSWKCMPSRETLDALVEDVMWNPKKNSLVYIKELLELHSKKFSSQRKCLIVKAMKIKLELTDKDDSINILNSPLAEIEEFCKMMVDSDNNCIDDEENSAECEQTSQTQDWEHTPLGLCPWHQEVNILSQIPEDDQDQLVYCTSDGEVY